MKNFCFVIFTLSVTFALVLSDTNGNTSKPGLARFPNVRCPKGARPYKCCPTSNTINVISKITDIYKFARVILIWVAVGQLFTILFIIIDRGYLIYRDINQEKRLRRDMAMDYGHPIISQPMLSETEV